MPVVVPVACPAVALMRRRNAAANVNRVGERRTLGARIFADTIVFLVRKVMSALRSETLYNVAGRPEQRYVNVSSILRKDNGDNEKLF